MFSSSPRPLGPDPLAKLIHVHDSRNIRNDAGVWGDGVELGQGMVKEALNSSFPVCAPVLTALGIPAGERLGFVPVFFW